MSPDRQIPAWPDLRYDAATIALLEHRFLLASGAILGAVQHVRPVDRDQLHIDLLRDEAMKTSAIEGRMLDRLSVQSSLRHHLGLFADNSPMKPHEWGVAGMMADVFATYAQPLTHAMLFRWHGMLLEAPPTARALTGMGAFVQWFNKTAATGPAPLPTLVRAGLSQLYLEKVRPFGDGNGPLGRALAEKALAQGIGQPSLIALAVTIERKRQAYWDQLERHQKSLDVTPWLEWFAQTVLTAQQVTADRIGFIIAKAHFHDAYRGRPNERQAKVIARIFREGPDGFEGGLSAENYILITGTSRATATRDLLGMVEMGALSRTGAGRYTRYWLNLSDAQNRRGGR